MKKTRFALAIAAVAAMFATSSCNKNEVPEVAQRGTTINAQMPEDDADPSKVYFKPFDGQQASISLAWNKTAGQEVIRAFCNDGSKWVTATTSTSCTVDAQNDKLATFVLDLPQVAGGARDYYLASPSGSTYQIVSGNASDYLDKIRFDSKLEPQISVANGPDARTILLVSKHQGYTETPKNLNAEFKAIEAFGRMTVTNYGGPALKEIQILFPDREYVTGFLDYKISTDECFLTKAGASTNYIKINPKNISINSTSFVVWFALAPQTFAKDETVKFIFVPSDGTDSYIKEVSLPKALAFTSGKASGFTLNMSGVKPKEEKVLTFDFSTNFANLQTNYWNGFLEATISPVADDGKAYNFLRGRGLYFNTSNSLHTLHEDEGATNGYFGLPAITGFKLVGLAANRTGNTGATVKLEITDDKPASGTMKSLTGEISWSAGVVEPAAISLTGTTAGKMYYMHSLANTYVPFSKLTLTYESE